MSRDPSAHFGSGTSARCSARLHAALWTLSVLFFGLCSVAIGMNVTWDTRNYHFYNAYSLLHGRLNLDWAPAQRQNFLNPALEVLPYLAMRHAPARLVGFALGAAHGLNFALAVELGLALWKRVAPDLDVAKRWALSLLAAATGCYAAGFAVELGSLSHDNVTSLFGLSALWLVCTADEAHTTRGAQLRIGIAGLLMGLGVGLKLNAAVFAVALVLTLPLLATSVKSGLRDTTILAACTGLGVVLSFGWWAIVLYRRFGSPLFPFYNDLFHSKWLPPITYADVTWPAKTLGDAVSFPFRMGSLDTTGCEQAYRDGRYIIWILGLLSAPLFLRNGRGGIRSEGHPHLLLLIAFSIVAFALSMKLYGYMRYLILLELLVPIVVMLLAGIHPAARRWALPLVVALLIGNALWLRPPQAERVPWQDRYFTAAPLAIPSQGTLIVMMGNGPNAYVIPFFDPAIRFLRPEGNLFMRTIDEPASPYEAAIWKQIRDQRDALYVMVPHTASAVEELSNSWPIPEWEPDRGKSLVLQTNIEAFLLIPMKRTAVRLRG